MSGRSKDAVQTYSLGMKQRLGIAAAMLSDPDLLLLDEPANGLDPGGMVAMRETLRYFTESLGKTVVISSHLLHEVELLADVVGIIDRGRLLREGDLQQLLEDAGRVKVRVARRRDGRAPRTVLRGLAPGPAAVRRRQRRPGRLVHGRYLPGSRRGDQPARSLRPASTRQGSSRAATWRPSSWS